MLGGFSHFATLLTAGLDSCLMPRIQADLQQPLLLDGQKRSLPKPIRGYAGHCSAEQNGEGRSEEHLHVRYDI